MEHEQIERINELARKKKTVGLTADELEEQAQLRISGQKQATLGGFLCLDHFNYDSVRQWFNGHVLSLRKSYIVWIFSTRSS